MMRRVVPISLAAMALGGLLFSQAVAGAEEGSSTQRDEVTARDADSERADDATMGEHCRQMMKDMSDMRDTMEEMHGQMGDMARMHEAAKSRMQEMHDEMMDGMGQMREDMARMHPSS